MNSVYVNLSFQSTPPFNTITLLLPALTFRPLLLHPSTSCPTITHRSSSNLPHRAKAFANCKEEATHSSLPIPIFTSFNNASKFTMKSQGDMIHLYLTPLSILNCSLSPPFTLTMQTINLHTLNSTQQFSHPIIHSLYWTQSLLLTLLYAFSKSIKTYTHFLLSYFLTHMFSYEELIYTTPPNSKATSLIINQTSSHSTDSIY